MEVGISTATFFSKKLTEDTFSLIREMGIGTVEVFLNTFTEYRPEFGDLLKERKGNLNVYSVHTLNQHFEPELFNIAPRTRADAEFFLMEAADTARKLGAKYYTFHGPARLKRRPYIFDYPSIGNRLTELNGMLRERANGLEFVYENVHWAFFSEPSFFANLKEHTDVKACLDIKQAMQAGIPYPDFIEVMGSRLKNVHLCDYDRNGKLAVPGKGSFDFPTLFHRLLDIGYDGPMMMELYAGDYSSFDEVRAGYTYLYECLEKVKKERL